MLTFRKIIFGLIAVLLIGGVGGVLGDQVLLPALNKVPFLGKLNFLGSLRERTVIINKTEEKIIIEDQGLQDAISKINPSLALVRLYKNQELVSEGTAFFITSDGLLITRSELVSLTGTFNVVTSTGDSYVSLLKKVDSSKGLAILKIREELQTTPVALSKDNIKLGEKVFIIGMRSAGKDASKFLNMGVIRESSEDIINTNMNDERAALGAPLLNLKGEVTGVSFINGKGRLDAVPAEKIKEFMDNYLKGLL